MNCIFYIVGFLQLVSVQYFAPSTSRYLLNLLVLICFALYLCYISHDNKVCQSFASTEVHTHQCTVYIVFILQRIFPRYCNVRVE